MQVPEFRLGARKKVWRAVIGWISGHPVTSTLKLTAQEV